MIDKAQITAFQRDGVIMLPGVMREWVEVMRAGVAANLAAPSEFANENGVREGRFFDDYVNWQRIPEIGRVVRESPTARLAAEVMCSKTAQFFHDHVLVKAPGTPTPTPWHQDAPYYFVEGTQTVSFWMPLDPVREASLRFIAGSHLWDKPVRPVTWSDDSDFYQGDHDWIEVPDPDSNPDGFDVLEWPMQPGDAVLFDFRTVHGARGNFADHERRALSLRWVGDDARFIERPGRTSPPFPGHGMTNGQPLRQDWFPIIHGGNA